MTLRKEVSKGFHPTHWESSYIYVSNSSYGVKFMPYISEEEQCYQIPLMSHKQTIPSSKFEYGCEVKAMFASTNENTASSTGGPKPGWRSKKIQGNLTASRNSSSRAGDFEVSMLSLVHLNFALWSASSFGKEQCWKCLPWRASRWESSFSQPKSDSTPGS